MDGRAADSPNSEKARDEALKELLDKREIIIPPPDIKHFVVTTAKHVAISGVALEAQILAKHSTNPKFAFINPDSPYNAFYKAQIAAFINGSDLEVLPEPKPVTLPPGSHPKKELTREERLADDIGRSKCPDGTVGTPDDSLKLKEYYIESPPSMTSLESDTIKLTAQFIARNGSKFLAALNAREARNPEYDFLKSTHRLYGYFQGLVEAYRLVIEPPRFTIDLLEASLAEWQLGLVKPLLAKAERVKLARSTKKTKDEGDVKERKIMATIDWFDFVMAGQVDFSEKDSTGISALDESCTGVDGIMRFVHNLMQQVGDSSSNAPAEDDMDVDMGEMIVDKISAPVSRTPESGTKQMCPICKTLVPVADISEHMRIELLDPKWREQKQAMQDKHKISNIAPNSDITRHLTTLAGHSDIFMQPSDSVIPVRHTTQTIEDANSQVVLENYSTNSPVGTVPQQLTPSQTPVVDHISEQVHPFLRPPPPGLPQRPLLTTQPQHSTFDPDLPPQVIPNKKRKLESPIQEFVPETDWLALHPGNVKLVVTVPKFDNNEWVCTGQDIALSFTPVSTITEVKQALEQETRIPSKKLKLRVTGGPWLKDNLTLASYNFVSGFSLTAGVKERGKKK